MNWLWCGDSESKSATTNMEIDRILFSRRLNSEILIPVVRLYEWASPAVTAGRLQNIEDVRRNYPGMEVVIRPTGGRAVVHGHDLTVSVVVHESDLCAQGDETVIGSFRRIAQPLVDALNILGVTCGFGHGIDKVKDRLDCFSHVASCDIVNSVSGEKTVGCAQRRVHGVILQQMSIPTFSNRPSFHRVLREAMGLSYGTSEWNFVDSQMALCYTEPRA